MSDDTPYRSIILEPDWAHQKYFDWRMRHRAQGVHVLSKATHGVERLLALIEPAATREALTTALQTRLQTVEIVVHDFNAEAASSFRSGRRLFTPLMARDRLLNIATYVIDLARSDEELLAAMSSDYRRKIRKAAPSGVSVEPVEKPAIALQERFATAFGELARERGLAMFDTVAYGRMYENGDAVLYVLRQQEVEMGYLHVYRAGPSAIFMSGVNLAKANDGAGQFLHWEIIRDLKQRGLRWYDLGGVRSFDDSDGISRFKKGFGGAPVKLGGEWGWRARWVDAALNVRRLISGRG